MENEQRPVAAKDMVMEKRYLPEYFLYSCGVQDRVHVILK